MDEQEREAVHALLDELQHGISNRHGVISFRAPLVDALEHVMDLVNYPRPAFLHASNPVPVELLYTSGT